MTEEIEVIGSPRVELYVRSSLEHTDFVARLCDVQPDGRSINLCDGFVRLAPGQGERAARWIAEDHHRVVAYCELLFNAGIACACKCAAAGIPAGAVTWVWANRWLRRRPCEARNRLIYHDAAHPSALILPVTSWWRDAADIEVLQYT